MSKIELACIIDDDSIFVYGVKKMFEIHHVCDNVLVFSNGEEAIKYITSVTHAPAKLPDVIMLDINMPIMDGWDFLEEYRKLKPILSKDITIHMVSSSIHKEDIDRANSYEEVSEYIVKPIMSENFKRIFGI